MHGYRIPKLVCQYSYIPTGRRNVGRTRKMWKDGICKKMAYVCCTWWSW